MKTSRLEAFSDGVLAIIITIMVLELKGPHAADLAALKPLVPRFFSYVLSFIYVGIYWNNHHHLFQYLLPHHQIIHKAPPPPTHTARSPPLTTHIHHPSPLPVDIHHLFSHPSSPPLSITNFCFIRLFHLQSADFMYLAACMCSARCSG